MVLVLQPNLKAIPGLQEKLRPKYKYWGSKYVNGPQVVFALLANALRITITFPGMGPLILHNSRKDLFFLSFFFFFRFLWIFIFVF